MAAFPALQVSVGYYFFNGWENFFNVSTVLPLHLLSCVTTLSATFIMTLNISPALLPFLPGDRILRGVGSGVNIQKEDGGTSENEVLGPPSSTNLYRI